MTFGLRHLISIYSPEMMGNQMAVRGVATMGNAAWPAANDALLIPLNLTSPAIVKRLFTSNGNASGGNVDLGIYTADFALIVSKGTTVQTGNSVPQFYDIADTPLSPGNYYLAMAASSTTPVMRRLNMAAIMLTLWGCIKMATAFPLPATITPASMTAAYLPYIGLEIGGTLI